jgi:hypothetical protein
VRPPDEQATLPLGSERATQVAGERLEGQSTRPPRTERQRDKVFRWLMAEEAVCATTFLARYVPRAAAHVHALRKLGFVIVSRPCSRGHYHETRQIEYVLEALPFDGSDGAA